MRDDIKERLVDFTLHISSDMRQAAHARIEALEAQVDRLKSPARECYHEEGCPHWVEVVVKNDTLRAQLAAAREALEPFAKIAPLVEFTDLRDGEVVHRQVDKDGKRHELTKDDFRRAASALAYLPAPEAAPTLTADFTKALPGGTLDNSTYEQIETALDRANAPMTDKGRFMTLFERIAALGAERDAALSPAAPTREEIAKIIDPDAKFEDIDGVQWSKFELQRRELAYQKADAILALKAAPHQRQGE